MALWSDPRAALVVHVIPGKMLGVATVMSGELQDVAVTLVGSSSLITM